MIKLKQNFFFLTAVGKVRESFQYIYRPNIFGVDRNFDVRELRMIGLKIESKELDGLHFWDRFIFEEG